MLSRPDLVIVWGICMTDSTTQAVQGALSPAIKPQSLASAVCSTYIMSMQYQVVHYMVNYCH